MSYLMSWQSTAYSYRYLPTKYTQVTRRDEMRKVARLSHARQPGTFVQDTTMRIARLCNSPILPMLSGTSTVHSSYADSLASVQEALLKATSSTNMSLSTSAHPKTDKCQ
jgi:hypothetical protein